MATPVYSYIRFSSKKQEMGDSIRRQREAGKQWVDRHGDEGYFLDETLNLTDKGSSAYRGKNLRDTNPLGKFIAMVKSGKIKKGSVLMLENLDRFSRQPVRKVYHVFCDIVEAGVNILTLKPEQMITMSNIDKMEVVFPVIISMQLGFEESEKKGQRLSAAWEKRREEITNGTKPKPGRCPGWLRWSKTEKRFVEKPGAKELIQAVFEKIAQGIGRPSIIRQLNASGKGFGHSAAWNDRYIRDMLKDRRVLGELKLHKFVVDEKTGARVRVAVGVKPGFYPAMIDEKLWLRAKAATAKRTHPRNKGGRPQKEGRSPFVNLFSGLIVVSDGYTAQVRTAYQPNGRAKRRLVSYGYARGLEGSCPVGLDYWMVEKAVLGLLRELTPADLAPPSNASEKGIAERKQALAGIDTELAKLKTTMEDFRSTPAYAALATSYNELTAKREALEKEIDSLSVQKATVEMDPLGQFKSVTEYIDSKPKGKQHELRLRLRSLIALMVEKITLDPHKQNHHCTADICVELANGDTRWIYDVGKVGDEAFREYVNEQLGHEAPASMIVASDTIIRWPKTMDKAKIVRDADGAFPVPAIGGKGSLGKKKSGRASASPQKAKAKTSKAKARKQK